MAHHNSSELENLLSAVTEALLADRDIDAIVDQYHVPRAAVDGLVALIRRLHVVLVGVQPSRRFVARLRHDLIGSPRYGMVSRVRYLPARVQIAAGVAVIAGFMILSRRRMLADTHEAQEIPALQ